VVVSSCLPSHQTFARTSPRMRATTADLEPSAGTTAEGLHSFLTVCTVCNLCRPSENYVHVGFSTQPVSLRLGGAAIFKGNPRPMSRSATLTNGRR
jgi:hypothetical protein